MPYVDGHHRYSEESKFLKMAEKAGLTHHVILTSATAMTRKQVGREAQRVCQSVAKSLVIGAVDSVMGGHVHVHLLANRRDARTIKNTWTALGHGRVEIRTPEEGDAHGQRLMVRYVQRKWNRDAYGEFDLILVTEKAA